jgi:hypothetical protein
VPATDAVRPAGVEPEPAITMDPTHEEER